MLCMCWSSPLTLDCKPWGECEKKPYTSHCRLCHWISYVLCFLSTYRYENTCTQYVLYTKSVTYNLKNIGSYKTERNG